MTSRSPNAKVRPKAAKGRASSALEAIGIDEICERLTAGESQTEIARSAGVGIATLVDWLAKDPERSARARDARIASAAAYADMAEAELRSAADPFELTKARELASHFRWRASKANPREYGDKIQNEHSGPNGAPIEVAVRPKVSREEWLALHGMKVPA